MIISRQPLNVKWRTLMAYLGENIKKLGFGLMRLPMIGGFDGQVDIEQMKVMVDLFMAKGFTYFDTAYGYGGRKIGSSR